MVCTVCKHHYCHVYGIPEQMRHWPCARKSRLQFLSEISKTKMQQQCFSGICFYPIMNLQFVVFSQVPCCFPLFLVLVLGVRMLFRRYSIDLACLIRITGTLLLAWGQLWMKHWCSENFNIHFLGQGLSNSQTDGSPLQRKWLWCPCCWFSGWRLCDSFDVHRWMGMGFSFGRYDEVWFNIFLPLYEKYKWCSKEGSSDWCLCASLCVLAVICWVLLMRLENKNFG